ncbi:M20/M25/M40 family metallo-hydrolase [Dellaglioa sp. L3N]
MKKEEEISLLKDLVALNTENDHEELVADYLKELFEKHGIKSEKIVSAPNRANLIVEIGAKRADGKLLGFTGHADVVSAGDSAAWDTNPFELTIKEGKMFGRGTTDMKAGLAGQVIAMIELHEDPHFDGHIRLIVTVGEEVGMAGSKQLAELGYADDLSALIVGEPSNTSSKPVLDYFIKNQLLVLPDGSPAEFSRHAIYSAHKGSIDIDITFEGVSAHSSTPQLGLNAIDFLIEYWKQQNEYAKTLIKDEYENNLLGHTIVVNTMINGGDQPNTVPGFATMHVKFRTVPEYSNNKIISDIQGIIDQLNANFEQPRYGFKITENNLPVYVEPTEPLVKMAQDVYKDIWNENSLVIGATGGTDATSFIGHNLKMPVVILGPGNESAHQINEYVLEQDYLDYIQIYKKLAQKFF